MPQAELLVTYQGLTLWTASKMQIDPLKYLLPVDDGTGPQPYADGSLGIYIPVQSEWGPITVIVNPEDGELPDPVRSWSGEVTFQDDSFYVESFDQIPDELSGISLPKGAGTYEISVDWAYVARPDGQNEGSEPPVESPWEKVVIRLS